MVISVNSPDGLIASITIPLPGWLDWVVPFGVVALVPTYVLPGTWDDSVRNWVYRVGWAWPGTSDEVSTKRRCSRVYGPRALGVWVREMWVVSMEVGEVVAFACKVEFPIEAGKKMRAVDDGGMFTVSLPSVLLISGSRGRAKSIHAQYRIFMP